MLEWQISKEVQLTYEHFGTLIYQVSYFSAFEFYQQHIDNFQLDKSYFNEVYKYDYEFYQFIKVTMFSDLSFMYDEVKKDPKSFVKEQKCLNDEFGPLLSRTYSKILSIDDVQRIYHDIYSSGKIGKTIISYLNDSIVKGDDIVIDFAKGGYSSFNIDKNKITISLSRDFITIEATVAHEIAHYIIQSVFKYYAMPDNVCKSFNDKESRLQYVGDWQHLKSKNSYDLLGFKKHKCFNPKIATFMKAYDDATKDILFKVADILKMSNQVQEYKEYVATDLASYLAKSSVVLSLLTLDDSISFESYRMSGTLHNEILHNTITNMMKYPEFEKGLAYDIKLILMANKLYKQVQEQNKLLGNIVAEHNFTENLKLKEQIESTAMDSSKITEEFESSISTQSVFKQIQDLLFDKYLPVLKSKLNLSEGETYFLHRAVDLVNRQEVLGNFDFQAEPVVRCVELKLESKFTDIPEDIIQACEKMNQFWEDYIFPHMD